MRDRGRDLRDRPDLTGEVGRHGVDRVGQVAPGPRHPTHVGLPAELALGADLTGHAGDLVGERGELVHHRVHRAADAKELPAQWLTIHLEGHLLGQISLRHRHDHAGDLGGRSAEVVYEGVDRAHAFAPRTVEGLVVDALGEASLPSHDAPNA